MLHLLKARVQTCWFKHLSTSENISLQQYHANEHFLRPRLLNSKEIDNNDQDFLIVE